MYMHYLNAHYCAFNETPLAFVSLLAQSKTRSSLQEKELKDSLQRVQDEAQKQLEVVNSQLQTRSGELKEKERELGEVRLKLEGEVASLQQQLLVRGEELQAAQKNITEVHVGTHVHVLYTLYNMEHDNGLNLVCYS